MQTAEELRIYTVTEVTSKIKNCLKEERSFQNLYVRGEISGLRLRDKTAYFVLKDEISIIEVVVFEFQRINGLEKIGEGMSVIVHGRLDFYQKSGKLNLIADGIYSSGIGEEYLRREKLKERLKAEGLFAIEAKKPMPEYVWKLGIVTSVHGAALQDILHAIGKTRGLEIYVADSRVQGEGAKESICRAIKLLNEKCVDVIIIARGGGSAEDLRVFDEEEVVRAIRNSNVPVITGIGHETDRTLADLAADKECPTPSYAGKFIYEIWEKACEKVRQMQEELESAVMSRLEEERIFLDNLASKISPEELSRIIQFSYARLELLDNSLKNALRSTIEQKKMCIEKAEALLATLNPEEILRRGYVYVTKGEKVVLFGAQLEENDSVEMHFQDALVHALVIAKEVEEWKLERALKKN